MKAVCKGNKRIASLKFTQAISDEQLPFLDLCLKPTSDHLVTSIHYTRSYLNYASFHPIRCKSSIPYGQFLRLRRICSEVNGFENNTKGMTAFFGNHGYPLQVIKRALDRVSTTPRETVVLEHANKAINHPLGVNMSSHQHTGQNHLDQKFPPSARRPGHFGHFPTRACLCAYRPDNNLRDSLVRSNLSNATASSGDGGTYPCGRTRCNTCVHTNASSTINTPGRHTTFNSKYTCTSNNVVYVIKCRACDKVYIGKTGRRLGDRFREPLRSTDQSCKHRLPHRATFRVIRSQH